MAEHDKKFYLGDGSVFSDLKGFARSLMAMPGEVYEHHVNNSKNDFANWIKFSMNQKELGERIDGQISKIELELEVLRHLVNDAETNKKRNSSTKKVVKSSSTVKKSSSLKGSNKKGSFNFASIFE